MSWSPGRRHHHQRGERYHPRVSTENSPCRVVGAWFCAGARSSGFGRGGDPLERCQARGIGLRVVTGGTIFVWSLDRVRSGMGRDRHGLDDPGLVVPGTGGGSALRVVALGVAVLVAVLGGGVGGAVGDGVVFVGLYVVVAVVADVVGALA